ncbi:MAG: beta-lactamase family protein [Xanthomonadales bacterium]|nr:beta-lactamase family protein [Xanthomonadales bacterium]
MKFPVLLLGLWLVPTAAIAESGELRELLERERHEQKMPGLRAAVIFPDGSMVLEAVGVADKKKAIPLDNDIGMPGGSTGKTFVAAVTMLLVEDGVLDLDEPVSKWLGDTGWYHELPNADDIRVRHLLEHSSGLPDYPGTAGFMSRMVWRAIRQGSAYFTPEELIGFSFGKRARHAAGQGYRYSDIGYLVLGQVIEAATDRTYYELLANKVLEPLGLEDIRPQDQSVLPDIATGYSGGGSVLKKDGRMKFDPRSEWTGGGLVMTPAGLARFHRALADGALLKPESFAAMLDAGWRDTEDPDFYYGYGLFVARDRSSWGHGGLWSGYRTHVAHLPHSGLTIAVQTNRDGRVDLIGLVGRIARLVHAVPE